MKLLFYCLPMLIFFACTKNKQKSNYGDKIKQSYAIVDKKFRSLFKELKSNWKK